jgi:serine protease Do
MAATYTLDSTFPDLVEKTLPQVVNISTFTRRRSLVTGLEDFLEFWGIPNESNQTSLGSGIVFDSSGLIITNHHVVAGADQIVVTFWDQRQVRAELVGSDEKTDLAVLRILNRKNETRTLKLVPATLGDSDQIRIGSPVFAVGNPFGFQNTVTTGIISAKHRTIGQGPFDNFLQTDASINPGNSGGPLYNLKGEVVGINTAIVSRTGQSSGLGFAIPVNEAKKIVALLKEFGRVPRPWLGILGERNSEAIADYYNLPTSNGIIVLNLVNRGPSDRAGLKRGDIIIELNDKKVSDSLDVEKILGQLKPGEKIKVKLYRGTKLLTKIIELRELPPLQNIPRGIL